MKKKDNYYIFLKEKKSLDTKDALKFSRIRKELVKQNPYLKDLTRRARHCSEIRYLAIFNYMRFSLGISVDEKIDLETE